MHFHYKDQMITAVYGNNLYLFYESHEVIHTVLEKLRIFITLKQGADTVTAEL